MLKYLKTWYLKYSCMDIFCKWSFVVLLGKGGLTIWPHDSLLLLDLRPTAWMVAEFTDKSPGRLLPCSFSACAAVFDLCPASAVRSLDGSSDTVDCWPGGSIGSHSQYPPWLMVTVLDGLPSVDSWPLNMDLKEGVCWKGSCCPDITGVGLPFLSSPLCGFIGEFPPITISWLTKLNPKILAFLLDVP